MRIRLTMVTRNQFCAYVQAILPSVARYHTEIHACSLGLSLSITMIISDTDEAECGHIRVV